MQNANATNNVSVSRSVSASLGASIMQWTENSLGRFVYYPAFDGKGNPQECNLRPLYTPGTPFNRAFRNVPRCAMPIRSGSHWKAGKPRYRQSPEAMFRTSGDIASLQDAINVRPIRMAYAIQLQFNPGYAGQRTKFPGEEFDRETADNGTLRQGEFLHNVQTLCDTEGNRIECTLPVPGKRSGSTPLSVKPRSIQRNNPSQQACETTITYRLEDGSPALSWIIVPGNVRNSAIFRWAIRNYKLRELGPRFSDALDECVQNAELALYNADGTLKDNDKRKRSVSNTVKSVARRFFGKRGFYRVVECTGMGEAQLQAFADIVDDVAPNGHEQAGIFRQQLLEVARKYYDKSRSAGDAVTSFVHNDFGQRQWSRTYEIKREVAEAIARGRTYETICYEIGCSMTTVVKSVASIRRDMRQLGLAE